MLRGETPPIVQTTELERRNPRPTVLLLGSSSGAPRNLGVRPPHGRVFALARKDREDRRRLQRRRSAGDLAAVRVGRVEQDQPLQQLGIEVNVQGPLPSVVKFAHSVETSSDFLVLRSFSLETGDGGTLGLRMAADLYLMP